MARLMKNLRTMNFRMIENEARKNFYRGLIGLIAGIFCHSVQADNASPGIKDRWETTRIEALDAAQKHNYPKSEAMLQQLVKEAGASAIAKPGAATNSKLLIILKDQASVFAAEKKFSEARVVYDRVLKITEQKYGRESPRLITPLNDVIKVTCVTGKCYDTLPELKRLLRIRRKAHGVYSREVPITLLLIGEAYEKHGDFSRALSYFNEAVSTEKKISGERSEMVKALSKYVERSKKELGDAQLKKSADSKQIRSPRKETQEEFKRVGRKSERSSN